MLNLRSCTSTAHTHTGHTEFLMSMMFYKTVRLGYGAPQTSLIVLGVYWRGLINAACGSKTWPTQTGERQLVKPLIAC